MAVEEEQRQRREKERVKQRKQLHAMYQNAITHMAFTNRLMSRGHFHEDLELGSTVKDLVNHEQLEDDPELRVPRTPVPRLEPAPSYTYSQVKN